MSSKVDPRGITDDFIDREVKMTWKDSLYSVYLFFRLGEAAASRKCLYINYTTLDKKSYAMGTVMDLEDVPPLPRHLGQSGCASLVTLTRSITC